MFDVIGGVVRGTVIDELQRRAAHARIDTWLWLTLRKEGPELPLESFVKANLREYLAGFAYRQRINELVEFASQRRLLPIDQFQWIKDDERQIAWLLSYAERESWGNLYPTPPTLIGKTLLLAIIDFYNVELNFKIASTEKMKRDWFDYLQRDIIFKWFDDKEQAVRCAFAWDWLIKNKSSETRGAAPVSDYQELLMFFDSMEVNDAQKKLDVASIKKKWSQQKYREGMKGKSQYNFVLSDQTIAELDKLAGRYEATRPQIIAALIKMESVQGTYLPQKIKKTSWD